MSPLQFYRDQAVRQMRAAEETELVNVRDRCRRAATAWNALAMRSERTDTARGEALSQKLLKEPSENPDRGSASRMALHGARSLDRG